VPLEHREKQAWKNKSFFIALVVAFIDLIGVGMVYPIFPSMLFDPLFSILPQGTSDAARGVYLGILIALTPLVQFFSSPLWGGVSDHHGRKKPLLVSQGINLAGYLIAVGAVAAQNIYLLFFSRIVIGFASGNISIVQATIADLTPPEQRTKNFGLLGMAFGTGFASGPLIGGLLLPLGYAAPFWTAVPIVAVNLILTCMLFRETLFERIYRRVSWHSGFLQLKKMFEMQGIRALFFAFFLHNFAWGYYFEFSPVYLIQHLGFTPSHLGAFYGTMGILYALSAGILIRPFIRWFKPEILFFAGNLFGALMILLLPFTEAGIWGLIIPLCFFVAFVSPTSSSMVSTHASSQVQGEALGTLSAVNAAAYVITPLCAASFVGAHPVWVFWIGGGVMLFAALFVLVAWQKRLWE
jgi:DHA1 family tetracycline resistance protein-like MFS transporter